MKNSLVLFCSIFLIGATLNGCAQGKAPIPSAAPSKVSSTATSSVQSSSTPKEQNITLNKDQISKDVVLRKGATANGKIIITSDQIEKIEAKHRETEFDLHTYEIAFYLTKEGSKQFSKASQEIFDADEEMSIWGKNGKVASAKLPNPITDGIFILSGNDNFKESKQKMESLADDATSEKIAAQ